MAYPYGEYDLAVMKLVRSLNFVGFGQHSGPAGSPMSLALVPRFPFAGVYGDMADFRVKVHTRPLPMAGIESKALPPVLVDPRVTEQSNPPELVLRLPANLADKLTCFASGQGRIEGLSSQDGVVRIKAAKPLPVGRSRYNCTAPGADGRFFWYSQLYIRAHDDGSWYRE